MEALTEKERRRLAAQKDDTVGSVDDTSSNALTTVGEVLADAVDIAVDIACAVGSGIGSIAEVVGDVASSVGDVAGDVAGSVFDGGGISDIFD